MEIHIPRMGSLSLKEGRTFLLSRALRARCARALRTRCARCPHRVAARADAITTFAAATKGAKCKPFVPSREP